MRCLDQGVFWIGGVWREGGGSEIYRHLIMSKFLYGNVLYAVACETSAQGGQLQVTVASKIDSHSVVAFHILVFST